MRRGEARARRHCAAVFLLLEEVAEAGAETMTLTAATGRTQVLGARLAALGMAVTVGTAFGFQNIGGYIPCKLCLEQRLHYYIGIPVAVLALAAAAFKLPPHVVRGLLLVVALLMMWSIWF